MPEQRPAKTGPVDVLLLVRDVPGGLPGVLDIPPNPQGLIVFAHGSGSSRLSPRNQSVAKALQQNGFATLLFDLLTEEETEDRANVFDIGLLAGRVLGALDCIKQRPDLRSFPVGLFGASTGAAAALVAAARRPDAIMAVVSRGGRPDLAGDYLSQVNCPVLLIVGGADTAVLTLNRDALKTLGGANRLMIVPGATHLFEEPGAMQQVVRMASDWFTSALKIQRTGA